MDRTRTARALATCALLLSPPALAVRPFITDDARVVGGAQAQLETFSRLDPVSLQHWALVGFGPLPSVELTAAAVHGAELAGRVMRYSATGPLLQVKWLVRETHPGRLGGFALSVGASPPLGRGAFTPPSLDAFAYLAYTHSFSADAVLVHANLGGFVSRPTGVVHGSATWGVGTQVRLYEGLHGIVELFSGDPYAGGGGGGATQLGYRYIVNDNVQLDATFGIGLWGGTPLPPWGTMGIRLATDPLWGNAREASRQAEQAR